MVQIFFFSTLLEKWYLKQLYLENSEVLNSCCFKEQKQIDLVGWFDIIALFFLSVYVADGQVGRDSIPSCTKSSNLQWMRALYNRVCTKDPTWKLAGFIVNDPLVDVLTIRLVAKLTTHIPNCILITIWFNKHFGRKLFHGSHWLIGEKLFSPLEGPVQQCLVFLLLNNKMPCFYLSKK